MRGKHRDAAERKRTTSLEAEVVRLIEELGAENERAAAAERVADEADALLEKLRLTEGRRDRAVADEVARLRPVIVELRTAVETEEDLAEEVAEAWATARATIVASYGGGLTGWEQMFADTDGDEHPVTLRWGVQSRNLSTDKARALQQARGLRQPGSTRPGREPKALNRAEQWLFDQMSSHARSRPNRRDRQLLGAWWAASRLEPTPGPSLSPFGVVLEDDAEAWLAARPAPDPAAADIAAATYASAHLVVDDRRWPNPLMPAPLFPRSSDGPALRWWYWMAASIEEVACDLGDEEVDADRPLDDGPVTDQGRLWRQVADMLATAAVFWLPPGQAYSYLASRPLALAERDEIRLPHQRVLLVPAEPVVLHPNPAAPPDKEMHRAVIDEGAAARRAATQRAAVPEELDIGRRLNFDEVLEVCGTRVEGVVLEADRSGKLTDRVIWCLAIPNYDGTAMLGRVAIPAWRNQTVWGGQLDQFAAVAAWGDWVEPPTEHLHLPADHGPTRKGPKKAELPLALHVLDVARTERHASSSEPTGRQIAPHMRRGHWRGQRYGPGSTLLKRVRIPPTVVNAGRGPLAPRIYRLPAPPAPAIATDVTVPAVTAAN